MISKRDTKIETAFREGHVIGFEKGKIVILSSAGNTLTAPNQFHRFRLGQKVHFSRNYINQPAMVLSTPEWRALMEKATNPHPINEFPEDLEEFEEEMEAIINGEYDYAEYDEEDGHHFG
jgi:hypothetical protein